MATGCVLRIALILPAALAWLSSLTLAASADSVEMAPLTEKIAGVSQLQWSQRWWVWATTNDDQSDGPISDANGGYCAFGQSGPVWFLAGRWGSGEVVRTCEIPAGKYVFFPLANYADWDEAPCRELVDAVRIMTDGIRDLSASLDGKPLKRLEKRRLAPTKCFKLAQFDGGEPVNLAAASGYYVMLKPLPKGRHVLKFGANAQDMRQDVTYYLNVK